MQLRARRHQPDLEINENKGVSHHTAMAAEVELLRQELAANPSTSVDFLDKGVTTFIKEEVEAYYNKQFGAMVPETQQPDAAGTQEVAAGVQVGGGSAAAA